MEMDKNAVKKVFSNQEGLHENLKEWVMRYVNTQYLRPIAEHTRKAFFEVETFIEKRACPIVLDSGCGTGRSTQVLAQKFPECTVIGIDKSEVRLSRSGKPCENLMWVRAELLDFWRLVLENKWEIKFHALYYPNPWPKASEATRRFHFHPIFPTLLKLAPKTELRTNWEIYAEEFAMASVLAGDMLKMPLSVSKHIFQPEIPETAFEEKYAKAGQELFCVMVEHK